jgi:hypothetical protein
MSKYKNRHTWNSNARRLFDSAAESLRYDALWLLQEAGRISRLQTQYRVELAPAFKSRVTGKTVRGIVYVADFLYYDEDEHVWVIEDVKGTRTKDYAIKCKLLLAKLQNDPQWQDYIFVENFIDKRKWNYRRVA